MRMNTETAIEIIARYIVWKNFVSILPLWEDYPLIGEFDWERVVSRVISLEPESPNYSDLKEAYKFLKERTDNVFDVSL